MQGGGKKEQNVAGLLYLLPRSAKKTPLLLVWARVLAAVPIDRANRAKPLSEAARIIDRNRFRWYAQSGN